MTEQEIGIVNAANSALWAIRTGNLVTAEQILNKLVTEIENEEK